MDRKANCSDRQTGQPACTRPYPRSHRANRQGWTQINADELGREKGKSNRDRTALLPNDGPRSAAQAVQPSAAGTASACGMRRQPQPLRYQRHNHHQQQYSCHAGQRPPIRTSRHAATQGSERMNCQIAANCRSASPSRIDLALVVFPSSESLGIFELASKRGGSRTNRA